VWLSSCNQALVGCPLQVATLEQEAAELRAAARRSASARLPGAGDVLTSLGLDGWKDARLRPKVRLFHASETEVLGVIHASSSCEMGLVTLHASVVHRSLMSMWSRHCAAGEK
jgi:hypothetical protein